MDTGRKEAGQYSQFEELNINSHKSIEPDSTSASIMGYNEPIFLLIGN